MTKKRSPIPLAIGYEKSHHDHRSGEKLGALIGYNPESTFHRSTILIVLNSNPLPCIHDPPILQLVDVCYHLCLQEATAHEQRSPFDEDHSNSVCFTISFPDDYASIACVIHILFKVLLLLEFKCSFHPYTAHKKEVISSKLESTN
jgi:hypothetical protein